MSIREWNIKVTAEELMVDESIVETVVSDAYKTANAAAREHNQIELSGFGKFTVSQPKIKRKMTKYHNFIKKVNKKLETESDPIKIEKLKYSIERSNAILEELQRRQQL